MQATYKSKFTDVRCKLGFHSWSHQHLKGQLCVERASDPCLLHIFALLLPRQLLLLWGSSRPHNLLTSCKEVLRIRRWPSRWNHLWVGISIPDSCILLQTWWELSWAADSQPQQGRFIIKRKKGRMHVADPVAHGATLSSLTPEFHIFGLVWVLVAPFPIWLPNNAPGKAGGEGVNLGLCHAYGRSGCSSWCWTSLGPALGKVSQWMNDSLPGSLTASLPLSFSNKYIFQKERKF